MDNAYEVALTEHLLSLLQLKAEAEEVKNSTKTGRAAEDDLVMSTSEPFYRCTPGEGRGQKNQRERP